MLATRPNGMQFEDWAAQVVLDLESVGLGIIQPREDRWQEWARHMTFISTNSQKNAPNPDQYTDWKVWAEQFILGVE